MKTLLMLSFRAILVHLLNQIFYLKKKHKFCMCGYRFGAGEDIFSLPLTHFQVYHTRGFCSNCQIIEELDELTFMSSLYKLFISGKIIQFFKLGELIQEKIDSVIGFDNFFNDDTFKKNVHLIDVVFDFNEEIFLDYSKGYSLMDWYGNLWSLWDLNEDGTKQFSDNFYFSNFWYAFLFWKSDFPDFKEQE